MSKPDPCGVNLDLGRLLALRRVLRSGVTRCSRDRFINRGHRVPGYVGYYLIMLLADGHAQLGHPEEGTGFRPVLATSEGETLHDDLEHAYRLRLRARFQQRSETPDDGHDPRSTQ